MAADPHPPAAAGASARGAAAADAPDAGALASRLRLSGRPLRVARTPYCRFHVDDYLPASLYEELSATFPEAGAGLRADAQGKLGLRSSEASDAFAAFCDAQPAWRSLVAHLSSDDFVLDVRRTFARELAAARGLAGRRRWRNDTGRRASDSPLRYALFEPVRVTFQLSHMPRGAAALPHTDAPRKLVSLVLYFADAGWRPEWGGGTEFFAPEAARAAGPTERIPFEGLEALDRVAFRPNRLVGFVRSPSSWHGVRPLACPPGRTRRALLINVKRLKWSKRHAP